MIQALQQTPPYLRAATALLAVLIGLVFLAGCDAGLTSPSTTIAEVVEPEPGATAEAALQEAVESDIAEGDVEPVEPPTETPVPPSETPEPTMTPTLPATLPPVATPQLTETPAPTATAEVVGPQTWEELEVDNSRFGGVSCELHEEIARYAPTHLSDAAMRYVCYVPHPGGFSINRQPNLLGIKLDQQRVGEGMTRLTAEYLALVFQGLEEAGQVPASWVAEGADRTVTESPVKQYFTADGRLKTALEIGAQIVADGYQVALPVLVPGEREREVATQLLMADITQAVFTVGPRYYSLGPGNGLPAFQDQPRFDNGVYSASYSRARISLDEQGRLRFWMEPEAEPMNWNQGDPADITLSGLQHYITRLEEVIAQEAKGREVRATMINSLAVVGTDVSIDLFWLLTEIGEGMFISVYDDAQWQEVAPEALGTDGVVPGGSN